MRSQPRSSIACVLCVILAACAAGTDHVIVAPSSAPADGIFQETRYGTTVTCLTEEALGDVLAGVEQEKGACARELAVSKVQIEHEAEARQQAERDAASAKLAGWLGGGIVGAVIGALLGGIIGWQAAR